MNDQYKDPKETPQREDVVSPITQADITQIRAYIVDLNKRMNKMETEIIKANSELKTIRDIAHAAARKK